MKLVGTVLLCSLSTQVWTQIFSAQTPTVQPATNTHQPAVSAKLNELAHRVLDTEVKSNALSHPDIHPWHLKIEFDLQDQNQENPVHGVMEEWFLSPFQWKRTYTSAVASYNGTEWSLSKTEHYATNANEKLFQRISLNLRVARPVIDPLYQASNIHPDYEMQIRRVNTAGTLLNCTSVPDPSRYAPDTNPDLLFPTICFDSEMHLRLTRASDTSVEFDDLQSFERFTVAHSVKVLRRDKLAASMAVTLLEPWANAEVAAIQPAPKAAIVHYHIEPGHPQPETVYEVGAMLPLTHNGMPFQGVVPVPILIQKDGTVKTTQTGPTILNPGIDFRGMYEAVCNAVSRWKYKPYLVDGQPVEVETTVFYNANGKPWVPSYLRPKPAPVTSAAEDFSSTYDPKPAPEKDLLLAQAKATRENKRILVIFGGDWCIWCKRLDTFFKEHDDLRKERDDLFVLLKVNMSPLNENWPFLSHYPKIPGYPWIFVLNADGSLQQSFDTDTIEDGGNSYSEHAVKQFLARWKKQ